VNFPHHYTPILDTTRTTSDGQTHDMWRSPYKPIGFKERFNKIWCKLFWMHWQLYCSQWDRQTDKQTDRQTAVRTLLVKLCRILRHSSCLLPFLDNL